MGWFGPTKPKRITKQEYEKVRVRLYGKLDKREREDVEKLFRSDLHESGIEAGISQAEFDAAIAWLKTNERKHQLEPNDIELIERYFAEHLRD